MARWAAVAVAGYVATVEGGGGAARPNFIFFQPDEMRAESLGCYGHPVSRTPNFDAFAASAVRFDQAHVSYTVRTRGAQIGCLLACAYLQTTQGVLHSAWRRCARSLGPHS